MVRLRPSPLSADGFQPFGELISIPDRSADFLGVNSSGWRIPIAMHGPPEFMILRSEYSGGRFSKLERHLRVAQTFIPIGRTRAVVAVAECSEDPTKIPRPEDVRAFIVDGSAGYVLREGTWHSVDRYPMPAETCQFFMITSRETQSELQSTPQSAWVLTQEVDYLEEGNLVFEILS